MSSLCLDAYALDYDQQVQAGGSFPSDRYRRMESGAEMQNALKRVGEAMTAVRRKRVSAGKLPEVGRWIFAAGFLSRDDTQPSTCAGVRLRSAEKVLQLNGLKEREQQASDRKALAEFLVTHNIRLESVGMYVPEEYENAYSEVVDGEVSEPPEELPSGE
jgi:hypothetical protein